MPMTTRRRRKRKMESEDASPKKPKTTDDSEQTDESKFDKPKANWAAEMGEKLEEKNYEEDDMWWQYARDVSELIHIWDSTRDRRRLEVKRCRGPVMKVEEMRSKVEPIMAVLFYSPDLWDGVSKRKYVYDPARIASYEWDERQAKFLPINSDFITKEGKKIKKAKKDELTRIIDYTLARIKAEVLPFLSFTEKTKEKIMDKAVKKIADKAVEETSKQQQIIPERTSKDAEEERDRHKKTLKSEPIRMTVKEKQVKSSSSVFKGDKYFVGILISEFKNKARDFDRILEKVSNNHPVDDPRCLNCGIEPQEEVEVAFLEDQSPIMGEDVCLGAPIRTSVAAQPESTN